MRLPEIDYGGSVPSTVQTAALPYEGAAGLTKVVQEGLGAYSREIIRTQQQEAGLRVHEGLQQAELAIKSRPYLSAQQVRDTLGDRIPPHVAERLQVQDPTTGQMVDNEQIPTPFIADALYGHAADRLVQSAANGIDGSGWQTHFKETIARDVLDRRQAMAQHQLQALDTYLQQTQVQQFERALNARDFGGALQILHGEPGQPSALPPAMRQHLRDTVESARQETPAIDALESSNVDDIRAQATRLKTDRGAMEAIPEARRKTLVGQLEARANKYDAFRLADGAVAFGQLNAANPLLVDRAGATTELETKIAGKDPEVQLLARAQLKQRLDEIDEERKNQTSGIFAKALQDFMAPGPDGRPKFQTAAVGPSERAYLTDPNSGREAAELWQSLLDKEQSREMRALGLAQQPTEANWAAYATLVKDMADFPSKYRAMSGEKFQAEVYGKVGPLVDKAMTLYKSAVEPTPDKRVVSGEERRSILEALPPEYRPSKVTKPGSTQAKVWDLMMERIGERKAREWENSKGSVPDAVLKSWVAEEWAAGTVKGGRFMGLIDKPNVPRAVAETAYPDKPFVPNVAPVQGAAPAPAGGTVVVEHKGKRLRIPRSKLPEALKDGAREVP